MEVPKKILNDGVNIPILGLGTWQLEKEKCTQAVTMALEIGYRHIDTAYAYYNQEYIRPAIKPYKREDLFITTKLWREYLEPKKVEKSLDECLKQLGIQYIDLFLIHWPDNSKPLSKVVEEMYRLKDKGKVRSVGVSNFTIHHLKNLFKDGLTVSINQVEVHPYIDQEKLLAFCKKNKIAVTAYSPIAHGKVFKDPVLLKIGKKYGKAPGQISLRWLIQKDLIVIPKGSSYSHLKENFSIFDFELDIDDMKLIHALQKQNKRIINPEFEEFEY